MKSSYELKMLLSEFAFFNFSFSQRLACQKCPQSTVTLKFRPQNSKFDSSSQSQSV